MLSSRCFKQVGLVLAVALVGCSDTPAPEGAVSLMSPVLLGSTGTLGGSDVAFHVDNQMFGRQSDVRMKLAALDFVAHLTDTSLIVDAITFDIGTVDISPEGMPPAGLRLRNVALRMTSEAEGSMIERSANRIDATARLAFEIDWQLELADGQIYDLGPGAMSPLAVMFSIVRDEVGGAELHLAASCKGACFDLPSTLSFEDGVLGVRAPLTITPAAN